ncbi:unnamed protein product [Blepharisma stoltei]|uniref:14-3-3 domain-containing protein n=1 Tax=Blepharisma stoltei TaxID=1481888 RepID=A0AAU9K5K9_9CILI|nr:unnamed protein product [Blepharisma stoltei]
MGKIDDLSSLSKGELLQLAKLAEHAERYEEMVEFIRAYVQKDRAALSTEDRNLLSAAYKNLVGNRRTSWRILNSIEQKETKRGNDENKQRAGDYKLRVENELRSFCREILRLIDTDLLPQSADDESRVFYLKMKGDYYRYICEFTLGQARDESSKNALECYQQAMTLAETGLDPTHPTKLGLALNFSVFKYEILQNPSEACAMAKQAFDDAIPSLDTLTDEAAYKDATMILQLLRDNLTLWQSEEAES